MTDQHHFERRPVRLSRRERRSLWRNIWFGRDRLGDPNYEERFWENVYRVAGFPKPDMVIQSPTAAPLMTPELVETLALLRERRLTMDDGGDTSIHEQDGTGVSVFPETEKHG